MAYKGKIHIVDDEPIINEILERILKSEGYEIEISKTEKEAFEKHKRSYFDVVLLDLMIPGSDGIRILEKLRKIDPHLIVIIMTAYASIESAIKSMKLGAYDYIQKPFKNEELLILIEKGLEKRRLEVENIRLKEELKKKYSFNDIIGKSSSMQKIFDLIQSVASTKATILIQGESGTGKELVAKAIHLNSLRAKYPFVVVNSGSLPPDLLESNLFGHVKGSFTGAIADKKGLFEIANNGSIFFDEIATINLETQAKLLRVIQEKEFMRLGGTEVIKVDARIIAATNVDLKKTVEKGRFREDLFYRLNVIKIDLPPLRERKTDIPLLVNYFIEKYSKENNKEIHGIDDDVMGIFMDYWWPGNVRELEHVIERAVVLTRSKIITKEDIPDPIVNYNPLEAIHQGLLNKIERESSSYFRKEESNEVEMNEDSFSFKEMVYEYQKELILNALKKANGVQKKAAELLKIKPTTLNEMIRRFKL
ncbi:MAG: sigma-54 dependent transcriptional regulator [Acidobacteriota bacterium]